MQQAETGRLDERFIAALQGLAPPRGPDGQDHTNRAALAALRRGLGQSPGTVPEMFRHLRELAWINPEREEDAFLVASLFAWHPHPWPAPESDAGHSTARWKRNFGDSLARLVVELNRKQRDSRAEGAAPGEAAASPDTSPPTTRPRVHEGVERRFVALLGADHHDIGPHLRTLVGLMRAHEVPVDWLQLFRHLVAWERPDRDVQRCWARSFWGSTSADQSLATNSAAASDTEPDAETLGE